MNVDIKTLSSKELYELAKRKEQVEQEAQQRGSRLADARKQKAELIAQHEAAVAATDKAIQELQEKRTRLVAEFKVELAPIELDIQELESKVKSAQAASSTAQQEPPSLSPIETITIEAAAAPPTENEPEPSELPKESAASPADSSDELMDKIRHIMRSRTYISESLLKEKLKANGFDTRNLKTDIEKLIREKKLEKKGIGNYALGKRK